MNQIELDRSLRKLRLSGMAETLETRVVQAQAESMAPLDFLSTLVGDELVRRHDRLISRRIKKAIFRDNGRSLDKDENLFQALRGTVGKQTRLTIGNGGKSAENKEVTVVPVDQDLNFRRNAWVEDNRRRVDEASDGKLAYVWVPNTGEQGFEYFNRYFFRMTGRIYLGPMITCLIFIMILISNTVIYLPL